MNGASTSPALNVVGSGLAANFQRGANILSIDPMWGEAGSGGPATFQVNNNLILQPSSGNVGIGTTTPSDRLDLGGGNIVMGYGMTTGTCSNVWNCVFSCPAGKQVIAGGCYTANNAVAIAQNQPLSTTQWQCGSLNYTATTWAWFLLCANIK